MRLSRRYFIAVVATLTLVFGQIPSINSGAWAADPEPSAPVATSPATLTVPEELRVGSVLTANQGVWEANPAPTFSVQWYSCSVRAALASATLPTGCSVIKGANKTTFSPVAAQRNRFLLAGVTAKNSVNSQPGVTSFSASTASSVLPAPAALLSAPGSSGTVRFTADTATKQNSKFVVNTKNWVVARSYSYAWYRCNQAMLASASAPTGCTQTSITTSSYVVTANDVGRFVVPFVTALSGATVVSTARIASAQVTLQSPVLTGTPQIASTDVMVGQTLSAQNGTWLADPNPSFSYQWHSCKGPVLASKTKDADCTAISGETQSTFTLNNAVMNRYIVLQVNATNAANSTSPAVAYSASTSKVLKEAEVVQAPTLVFSSKSTTGQPIVGSVISAKTGTWAGSPSPTKSLKWFVCDSPVSAGVGAKPSDCNEISGETDNKITAILDWQGKYVTFAETATNGVGAGSATVFAEVEPQETIQTKPLFTGNPSISGTARTGQTLSANPSLSTVGGDALAKYQWLECSASQNAGTTLPSTCKAIAGETEQTFQVTAAYEESFMVVRVTLENAAGSSVKFSDSTEIVTGPPVNLSALRPTSTAGQLRVDSSVSAGATTWGGYPKPNLTFSWYRCDLPVSSKSSSIPDDCVQISGATQTTYTPVRADSGKYLSLRTSATQGLEVVTVWSPTSDQVYEAPSFDSPPSVGTQHVLEGTPLQSNAGQLRGYPTAVKSYVWYRCKAEVESDSAAAPAGCTIVPGATSASYEFVAADVGKYLLTAVTITNDAGTSKRFSPTSSMVNSGPSNVSIAAPSTGNAALKVGSTITANDGVWTALPDPTFTYQWYRCYDSKAKSSTAQDGCNAISGATAKTYLLSIADAGVYVQVAVTATNPYANDVVFSPTTSDVGEDIRFEDEPRLTADRSKGGIVTNLPLSIRGTPVPDRTYRWLRCENQVIAASAFIPSNCVVIPKAIQAAYVLATADVTKYIVQELTLKNRLGSVTRYTASTQQVLQLPEISGNLTVTGNQWLGKTLQAGSYSVVSFPATEPTIQWFRGDVPILGAVSNSYTLTELDVDEIIHYEVSARNPVGSVTRMGGFTGIIGSPPRLLLGSVPVVCGIESDSEVGAGARVWTCPGSWQATPSDVRFSYQWYLCTLPHPAAPDVVPADCALVKKETDFEYLVSFKDERKFIAYKVVVSNGTEDRTWMSSTSARIYVKPKYITGAKTSFQTGQAAKDGSPRVGYSIEATVGKWNGDTTNVYTYQWFSCTKAVKQSLLEISNQCDEIFRADNSASSRVLSITADLAGKYIGVLVRGSYKFNAETDDPENSNQDWVYTSSTTKPVVEPPVNVTPPVITSKYPYVQATVTATDGTWRGTDFGTKKFTFSRSWWVCDSQIVSPTASQPAGCAPIANSPGSFKITLAQKDKFLTQAITASNQAGDTTIWSASTLEPASTGPVNTVSPKVTVVGADFPSTLTDISVSDGSWVGDPTPSLNNYSWFRCDDKVTVASEFRDDSCALITLNASGKTYRPIFADAGKFIVAAVTFSNGKNWVAYSASTLAVDLPPSNSVPPILEGAPFVAKPVASQVGTWDGSPAPIFEAKDGLQGDRQWFACDTSQVMPVISQPSDCQAITTAKKETFTPTVAQLNKFLLLRVTGVNRVGSAIAWSNYTPAVVSGPVMISEPTFSYPGALKNPLVGTEISTDGGIWQGTPIPTKTFEWLACETAVTTGSEDITDFADSKCEVIDGAKDSKLTPAEEVRGKFLMIHVRATNEHGSPDWYSATTTAVWMAPVIDHPVEVFGTTFNELRVKAKFDTWKAFPEVTKKYLWYVCDEVSLTAQESLPTSCEEITPSAATSIFKIPAAPWKENQRLVVRLVATNDAGDATIHSSTSAEIKPGPVNKVPPTISGGTTYSLNGTVSLSSTRGTWSPDDVELTYQWYRCLAAKEVDDELGDGCEVIPGANTNTYPLAADDPGKTILVAVKGENEIGASVIYSASTVKITEKVNNVEAPAVLGAPKVDFAVNGNDGIWRGFPIPAGKEIKRAWYACKTKQLTRIAAKQATGCALLPNTNKTVFNIPDSASIIGKYLVYSVSQSNVVAGSKTTVTVFSASTEMVADPPVVTADAVLAPPKDFGSADRPSVGTVWTVAAIWKKPAPALSYQWYSCEIRVSTAPVSLEALPAGSNCQPISGATTNSYTIRLADRGKFLLAATTGTNSAGVATSFTKSSADPVDQAPEANPMPAVTGVRSGGETLTVTSGTWIPADTTIRYRWISCNLPIPTTVSDLPSSCEQLDATGSSYLQDEAFDGGKYITVMVSGKFGKATTNYVMAVTAGTRVIPTIPTGNTKPELEYDSFLIGNLFTVKTGEWEGFPETKTYQWYRCDRPIERSAATLLATAGCETIPGATLIGFKATNAEDGKYLVASETGTNDGGSTTYFTASSEDPMYAGFEPGTLISVAADSLEIKPNSSITITPTPGTWSKPDGGSAVLVHRWVYCTQPINSAEQRFPITCSPMFDLRPGKLVADQDTRPLVLDMSTKFAGYYIARVEYVQKTGSPLNVDNPQNRETYRLSATTGKILIAPSLWNATVTSELHPTTNGAGYQEPKVGTEAIVGTAVSLTQVSAWQADTDPYSERALARVSWRGVGATDASFAYQWFKCANLVSALSLAQPARCSEIAGANSSSYIPVSADVLSYLSVKVTATNSVGSASAWTKTTWHVTQRATNVPGGEPTLTAVNQTGVSTTVTPGDWVGETSPTLAYSWHLCPTTTYFASGPNACVKYPGTGRSFTAITLGGRDLERYIVAGVKGTNNPFLTSDTTVNFARTFETTSYVASARIYEAPYWSDNGQPVNLFAGTTSSLTNSLAANVGETLRMDAGVEKWNATPSVTANSFTYSWYTCSNRYIGVNPDPTPPADCVQIPNQTNNALVLNESMIGKLIMGRVATQNAYGTGVSYSATTAAIAQRPFNTSPPTLNFGTETTPVKGKQITGLSGSWGGSPAPTVVSNSYRWYSCTSAVPASATQQAGCTQLNTQVSNMYTPAAPDRGKYIVYSLETSNFVNPGATSASTRHFSAGFGPVLMDPEFDATDPLISGKAHVGQTLSLSVPNVTSFPDATTTWAWYSCTTSASSQTLSSIPSDCRQEGTGNQTRLVLDDSITGRYIAVFAESTSRTLPTKKNSLFTLAVTKEPTNTAAPTISGTFVADGVNNAIGSKGVWSAQPTVSTLSYSWFQCDASVPAAGKTKPAGCAATPLKVQTNAPGSLLLTREMAGKFLVLAETATQASNNLGANTSVTHYSASTPVVMSPPAFILTPTVSGIMHVDEVLTSSFTKRTSFDPDTTAYQWHMCATEVTSTSTISSNGCEPIANAEAATFRITQAQAGKFMTVGVTLSNSVKSVTNYTLSTTKKVTMTPSNTSPVTIAGASPLLVGNSITATEGSWTHNPAISKMFMWYSCDNPAASAGAAIPANCTLVQNGIAKVYNSTVAQRGKYILVAEKATSNVNKSGAGDAFSVSATLGPIQMAPVFTDLPIVSGTLHVGETVTATMPDLQAFPVNPSTYVWLSCTNAVAASATSIPNGCAQIDRSETGSLTLSNAEAGKFVLVMASNTNLHGSVTKTSISSTAVTATPLNTSTPSLSGEPKVASGNLVAVSAGAWSSSPAVTIADYSYAWFTCRDQKLVAPTSIPADCTQVLNASSSSIAPTDAMAGRHLMARVTATVRSNKSGAGSASAFTVSSGAVLNKPQFGTVNPTTSGIAHLNEVLTATLAPVTGFEQPVSTLVWWQCSDVVAAGTADVSSSCEVIPGIPSSPTPTTITIRAEQVGKRVVLVQTVSNSQGSVSRSSASTLVVSSTPTISSDPVVTGANVFSSTATVSVSKGAWIGSPSPSTGTFSYTWYACNLAPSPSNILDDSCTLIADDPVTANRSSIKLSRAMDGKYLVARETITTSTNKPNTGSARRFTAGFGPINVAATATADPTINSNTASTGTRLRANLGTWSSGTNPIAYSYLWYACSTAVAASQTAVPTPNCSLINGFDTVDLVVPASAVNKYILLAITASNAGGTSLKTSKTTGLVTAATVAAARLGLIE